MNSQFLGTKIGILGGGQLARMLCLAGHSLGLEMHVLSPHKNDPAAQVTGQWHQGQTDSPVDLRAFFQSVDQVIIESEFLDAELLQQTSSQTGVPVSPAPNLIHTFSDRLMQKEWLTKNKIPTAAYMLAKNPTDALAFAEMCKFKVVIKKRRHGYDGYGTHIFKKKSVLESWLNENSHKMSEYIVEEFIPFRRELAQQLAINERRQVCPLPLVEWKAQDSKCLWVKGPHKDNRALAICRQIAAALRKSKYVGLFAFEIFDTKGGLFINEVAPRVHNSAHYSIEGLSLNQFTAHLMAVLDFDLPKISKTHGSGFAMLNLLGGSDRHPRIELAAESVSLHWYGKQENRQGRKMGHLTAISTKSPDDALRTVLKAKKRILL